ncbi:hypothetical protein BXZ70DRAFT_1004516 [Cristinia sonorae]|uniref:holo-[acyl-carrier-protein] synthase n=1 Tax=Cristinia sonorae TaxID=1940300 RepID=A0A8K0UWT0_9AGAR|nr:hypothetical protein BXZ70DRAFT_1004516 [Cristinia sonorae]
MWQTRVVVFRSTDVEELTELIEKALDLVDADSKTRLLRYYRKEDTFRGLIGKLLPRVLLREQGISLASVSFAVTAAGKPYMDMTGLAPSIGYSITHDNGAIAMAFANGDDLHGNPPAYQIGVDVMRLQLPKRHTFKAFIEIFTEQLTAEEHNILLSSTDISAVEGLRRFYLIWTLKEAYTKALGIGLGFEFKRINYDVLENTVRIDGIVPEGWEFTRFELTIEGASETAEETYVGVAARFTPGRVHQPGHVQHVEQPADWLTITDASDFLHRAVDMLGGA